MTREEQEYKKGYCQAIEDTCEWLSQQQDMLEDCFSDVNDFVDIFRDEILKKRKVMDKPKSKHGERFVKVKATLWTWTAVEDIIEFDTKMEQFIIPQGYQIDTKILDWEYIK